ncbi:MAG TPA: ATPase, T2SS/T4P/T4SS family [Alphaproteobacteria bacterium]|nr:ATPase, T2SS/T4P/T4SS family [Alphaproteobacteria bacterium]
MSAVHARLAQPEAPPPDRAAAIAERLVETGRLDRRGLERAQRLVVDGRESLLQVLAKLGLVAERDLAEAISGVLDLPLATITDYPERPLLEDRLSLRFLREARLMPIADTADGLVVAMADPSDRYAQEAIGLVVGRPIQCRVAVPAELEAAIDRLYGADSGDSSEGTDATEIGGDLDALDTDVERLRDLASEAPVIRLVNQIVGRAVEARASDIHLEPFENGLKIRFRIDGLLREVEVLPARLRAAVISRIKIMAKLNIAERRLPQDGRIKLAARGTPLDLRVAVTPSLHGEAAALRILHRETVALDFDALGIGDGNLQALLRILDQPHGIILVTGPTGSGKTTTLYAGLSRLNTPERKILTVEDPIEYQLEGITQIQVQPSIGLDFANVLRSLLRHDPDVMMVGEIRDRETAEIAVQAALTGHLVLSTLHTNSAAGSIARLIDMGVPEYLLASTLTGAMGQRLVRTLCPDCREPFEALPEFARELGLDRLVGSGPVRLWRPRGCASCHGTGYRGRTTISEVLVSNDALRRLILQRADARNLHQAAVAEGMVAMFADGAAKALAGVTTIEEVLKSTRDA